MLSSTAIAACGATADALATAFYVMGVDRTGQYCDEHPEVSAILVCPTQKNGKVAVHAFNLESDRWQCFEEVRVPSRFM